MAAEFSQHEVDPDDPQNTVLHALAQGQPWLFIVAHNDGDGIGMKVETGGGIHNMAMIRKMLTLTIDALREGS